MSIKIKGIIIIILVLGSLFYLWHKNVIKKMEITQQKEMNDLRSKLTKEYEADFFKVYGADENFNNEEINFYVKIPRSLSLVKKLEILADRLSRFKFQYHPIRVLRIENRENKRIAIIELREPNNSDAFTWKGGFFQGSTGGLFTTITLVNTFLQPDYQGEWIDGVEFYYEGEPISNEWDHIRLSGIIYR